MEKKICKINEKKIVIQTHFYFVYLFTICDTSIAGKKRLDVLIWKQFLWEVAIPTYTVHHSILRSPSKHNFCYNSTKNLAIW